MLFSMEKLRSFLPLFFFFLPLFLSKWTWIVVGSILIKFLKNFGTELLTLNFLDFFFKLPISVVIEKNLVLNLWWPDWVGVWEGCWFWSVRLLFKIWDSSNVVHSSSALLFCGGVGFFWFFLENTATNLSCLLSGRSTVWGCKALPWYLQKGHWDLWVC